MSMFRFNHERNESTHPAGNYLFRVNKGNDRAMYEISSKITIMTPERRQYSGVFLVKLLAGFSHFSGVSIIAFEQVNDG